MSFNTAILGSERLFPSEKPSAERVAALSLLDAVSVDFTAPCATWLFQRPTPTNHDQLNRALPWRQSLRITLQAYPQWCGRLKLVTAVDPAATGSVDDELAPHARRLGRVHLIYGTPQDPGVDFILAESTAILDDICPVPQTGSPAVWDRKDVPIAAFVPSTPVKKPHVASDRGPFRPVLAVQITFLACGGLALAVKLAHPLADTHALTHFVKDWASISRALHQNTSIPSLNPVFDPGRLDACAAGNIDSKEADPTIIKLTESLPCHRYDWWVDSPGCPWPVDIPEPFRGHDITPAGKKLPWAEYDGKSPTSHYLVRLSNEQVELLYREVNGHSNGDSSGVKFSRHDAVLAHIWSCINRARLLHEDTSPIHCDLTCGLRPLLQLGDGFLGSPTLMINVEMTGNEASTTSTRPVAQRIRDTIRQANDPALLAAHLHSVAHEKTPQRIWQGFLGRRHIMVTTWARTGLYEVDFGGGAARYVEDVLENLDGLVVIKEAPPPSAASDTGLGQASNQRPTKSWTDHGVDVILHLREEDMTRLIRDPLLLFNTGHEPPDSVLSE